MLVSTLGSWLFGVCCAPEAVVAAPEVERNEDPEPRGAVHELLQRADAGHARNLGPEKASSKAVGSTWLFSQNSRDHIRQHSYSGSQQMLPLCERVFFATMLSMVGNFHECYFWILQIQKYRLLAYTEYKYRFHRC